MSKASRRAGLVNVHTTDGRWVGQFYGQEGAAGWVESRVKPEMFTIDPERKEGAEAVGGIFIAKEYIEDFAEADPADGFVSDEDIQGTMQEQILEQS